MKCFFRPLPPVPKMNISQETIDQLATGVCPFLNKVLVGFENISLGKDSRLFCIFFGWTNNWTWLILGLLILGLISIHYKSKQNFGDTVKEENVYERCSCGFSGF